MAQQYGCLPTEILEKGTTLDIQIFTHVANFRERQSKLKKGEDINSTYSPEELQELWQERMQR